MRTLSFVIALAFFLVAKAWAQAPVVGAVKTVRGEAFVTTAGQQTRAAVGTPVYAGSRLSTAAQSSLGVVLNDSTVLSLGADTTLTMDDYLYAPQAGQLKLASKLAKGSLGYLSGAIAKLKPEAVSIQTSTGTLGIRGTRLLAMDTSLQSFVALVPDPDGKVGQVVVNGTRGTQFITEANTMVPLNGATGPTPAPNGFLQQQFADVLNAFPPQPPLPSVGPSASGPTSTSVGAGAQTGAAVGGLSGSAMAFGVIATGLVIEGSKGSTGTTGTR